MREPAGVAPWVRLIQLAEEQEHDPVLSLVVEGLEQGGEDCYQEQDGDGYRADQDIETVGMRRWKVWIKRFRNQASRSNVHIQSFGLGRKLAFRQGSLPFDCKQEMSAS